MFQFKRVATMLVITAGFAGFQTAGAQTVGPALTTIQDILYRADGTRFNGTMFIHWKSFLAGDTSNIAQADLTLQIVNGVLNVKLVPTTTATPGAQYSITYNSAGKNQFTEAWAVPPNALILRVRDVRISSGAVVGPPPVLSPVQIGDVIGLNNALSVRPSAGVGFAIGRAAVINQAGQIDAAAGSLTDCVKVDGSSGPCGGSGSGLTPSYSDGETPSGVANGVNPTFTLLNAPSPVGSLSWYRNGVLQLQAVDYSLANKAVTFFAGSIPLTGDSLVASYRYANPSNPLGSLAGPQVICSSGGATSNATTLTQLGTCTIPGGLLGNGDRIEVQFHYGHAGSTSGFTGEVHWGSTVLLARAATAADGVLAGKTSLGLYAGGQSWDAQTWGSSLAQTVSVGATSENITAHLTISFYGQMPSATTDSVALRNFTVIRYPAQSNP